MKDYASSLLADVKAKNPAEPEFHQAGAGSGRIARARAWTRHPEYRSAKVLERILEPERVVMFRVPWLDDQGEVQINRGFRIEMNSAIGPYKGGLRFHPSVNARHPQVPRVRAGVQELADHARRWAAARAAPTSIPKGKSDNEVMRFCQSFMTELCAPHRSRHRRAGRRHRRRRPRDRLPVRPVQAAAERVHRRADRQGPQLGRLADPARGDRLRRGLLRRRDARRPATRRFEGKTCLVSGSGNVAQYTVEKLLAARRRAPSRCPTRAATSTTRPASIAEKLTFVMDAQERAPRPDRGVRGRVQGPRSTSPLDPKVGSQPALGPQGALRVPERDAERDRREGRAEPPDGTASTSCPRARTCRRRSTA